jgi:hypothetical protein
VDERRDHFETFRDRTVSVLVPVFLGILAWKDLEADSQISDVLVLALGAYGAGAGYAFLRRVLGS